MAYGLPSPGDLDIGVPYSVPNYPSALNPATDGCRNVTGKVHADGAVEIYAVTSTVSPSRDQGADPNKLVTVKDILNATSLPKAQGNGNSVGHFVTLRSFAESLSRLKNSDASESRARIVIGQNSRSTIVQWTTIQLRPSALRVRV